MKRNWYHIMNKGKGGIAEILIYGVIGPSFWDDDAVDAKTFVQDFKALEKDHDVINIRINSPGGSVWDGLPIINAILESKKEVNTYNDGIAYSMGAMILQAGKKRYAAANSMTLMHAPLNFVFGNAKALRKNADDLDKYAKSLATTVANKTGKTEEDIMNTFFDGEDHLYTSAEALEENLIDEVLNYDGLVPDGAKDLNMNKVFNFFKQTEIVNQKPAKKSFGEMVMNTFFGAQKSTDDMKHQETINSFLAAVKDGSATIEMQNDANTALAALGITEPLNLVSEAPPVPTPEPNPEPTNVEPTPEPTPEPTNTVSDEVLALFGEDAQAEGFNVVDAIKALQANARAPKRVKVGEPSNEDEVDVAAIYGQMEHHQRANQYLKSKI